MKYLVFRFVYKLRLRKSDWWLVWCRSYTAGIWRRLKSCCGVRGERIALKLLMISGWRLLCIHYGVIPRYFTFLYQGTEWMNILNSIRCICEAFRLVETLHFANRRSRSDVYGWSDWMDSGLWPSSNKLSLVPGLSGISFLCMVAYCNVFS
jgi:hypothetical protein